MTKDNTPPQSPRKRNRRRWIFLCAFFLLLMIVTPLGVWWYMRWSAYAELQAVIAELDKNDPNWRLEDILKSRRSIPNKDNGAPVVIAARTLMPRRWGEVLVMRRGSFDVLPPPVQLNGMQSYEMREDLKKVAQALAKALELGKFKTGEYAIRYTDDWFGTDLTDIQNARQVAYLLQVNAYIFAQDKKSGKAWDSAIAAYRVSTSIGNTDTLLSHLARAALRATALQNLERVLGQGEVSADSLAAAQKMIDEDLDAPILRNAIRGERAGIHRVFTGLADGKINLRQVLFAKKKPFLQALWSEMTVKAQIPKAHAITLKFLTKSLRFAGYPPDRAHKKFVELDAEIVKNTAEKNFPYLAKMLLPAATKIAQADIRVRTSMHCAIIGLACERFRLAHGCFPKDLSELAIKNYIASIPIDPYDGKRLRFRAGKNGVVVYSVGPKLHGRYDGRALDNLKPAFDENHTGPSCEFRVYRPSKRRLPSWLPKLNRSQLVQRDVWTAGKDEYHAYRTPAVIVTKKKTLLAFCEGSKDDSRRDGNVDLLVKRSADYGWTWDEHKVVCNERGDFTIGNPCPVVDQDTGVIWLPFTRNGKEVFVTRSEDDGQSWAKPVNLTDSVNIKSWVNYVTGPGIGIQLQFGKHKGRLVIPCCHRDETGSWHSHIFCSDDHGKSWKLGGTVAKNTGECQVVELNDGKLLINMQSQPGSDRGDKSKANMRAVAFSDDGGETWHSLRFDRTLVDPLCQASLIRNLGRVSPLKDPPPPPPGEQPSAILFSNPASKIDNAKLTIRASDNNGRNWKIQRVLNKGPSGNSCLVALPDGTIGCLYETGNKLYENIRFARFEWGWLEGAGLESDWYKN